MLRGRRLASDDDLIELSDKCIDHEFQSIGYSRRGVQAAMENAKKKFEENYSGHFVKIEEDEGRKNFSYGGGLFYNKNYKRSTDELHREYQATGRARDYSSVRFKNQEIGIHQEKIP